MEQPVKLPSGKWRARIFKDGKRLSLGTFDTRKMAAEATARATLNKEDERRGLQKFHKYANLHIQIRKDDMAKGSWDNFVRSYNRYLEPVFGQRRLCDITRAMVKRWWVDMGKTPRPRRTAYTVLSNIMRAAEDDGEFLESPVHITGASKDVSTPRPTFTPTDVALVRMCASDAQVHVIL